MAHPAEVAVLDTMATGTPRPDERTTQKFSTHQEPEWMPILPDPRPIHAERLPEQMSMTVQQPVSTYQQPQRKPVVQQPLPIHPQPARIEVMGQPSNVTKLPYLGETPEYIDCPFCKTMAKTKVEHQSSDQTAYVLAISKVVSLLADLYIDRPCSISAALCCVFCGIIGVFVPYLCGWSQDVDHYCTNCNRKVTHRPYNGVVNVISTDDRQGPSKFQPLVPMQVKEDATNEPLAIRRPKDDTEI